MENINKKYNELKLKYFSKQEVDNVVLDFNPNSINASLIEQMTGELSYYSGINQNLQEYLPLELDNEMHFYRDVQNLLKKSDLLADLGAGVRPFELINSSNRILVEPFGPYREYLKRMQLTNALIINDDALNFLENQSDKSIDLVVAIDLIEHLDKPNGFRLIKEMKRVCRQQALIITPLGFAEQHVTDNQFDEWGFKGNILQTHLSGWYPEDFEDWYVLISPNYKYSSGHVGNLAAIYERENISDIDYEIVLNSNKDEEILEALSSLDNISRVISEKSRQKVQIWLPIRFHPASHSIYPTITFPFNCRFYLSNPELYKKDLPSNVPGKIKFSSNSKKYFVWNDYEAPSSLENYLYSNGVVQIKTLDFSSIFI